MHTTGLKLAYYTIAYKLGFATKAELEAAQEAHLEKLNAPLPECDSYTEVHSEGRGVWRECSSTASDLTARASLWK